MKKVKWIFVGIIGLIICVLLILRVYFTFFPIGPPDVFYGIKPDLGNGPQEQVMSYVKSHTMLGTTEYEASVGTSRYNSNNGESWDYYFCWISKRYQDKRFGETWYPFFNRWLVRKKVPVDLWDKDVKKVVSFDESTRNVSIDFGVTNYTCTLPPD